MGEQRGEGEGEGERGMKEFVCGGGGVGGVRGGGGKGRGTQGRGMRTRIIHVMVLAFACLGPLRQLGPFVFSMAEDGFSREIIIILWTTPEFYKHILFKLIFVTFFFYTIKFFFC